MKKLIIGCLTMFLAIGLNCFTLGESCSDCLIIASIDENTMEEELSEAIEWMYDNGLTIYNTPDTFMVNDSLTREQASKFFAEFAEKVLNKEFTKDIDLNKFSDLEKADSSLTYYIIQANHLGLFQGLDGKFMPRNKLTQAQAITVAIRMIDGKLDESKGYWFRNYYNNANDYGLLKRGNFDISTLDETNITRGDTALILYSLYKYISDINVFDVMEYNNNLVDAALVCIDSENAVGDAYTDGTSEQLKSAIDNTLSKCKEAIKEVTNLGARNNDDSLQKAILNYIAYDIIYYNKVKKLVPFQDIKELSPEQEEVYDSIIDELDKMNTIYEQYGDELIKIQEKFAKKHRFELENE